MPFLVGFIISLILNPIVNLLIRRGNFTRSLASFVVVIVFTLSGASLCLWAFNALSREAAEFLEAAPSYIEGLQQQLSTFPYVLPLLERLGQWLGTQSIQSIRHVPGMIIGLILILLSAFFFLRDREAIFAFVLKHCPYVKSIGKRLYEVGWGFLKTEFILFAMVGAVCIVALWILQSPYALMLGFGIALLDSLPILGAGIVLWPWAGYLALVGDFRQAAWLLVLFGVVTVIRNVIGPRILGDQIGMHPLVAIMAIFFGFKFFGAFGILIGPALVIVAESLYTTFGGDLFARYRKKRGTPSSDITSG